MFFFSVGEAATSKWTHGEVAVFGSTVYKIFALKCQKLRTSLASLTPCVITLSSVITFKRVSVLTSQLTPPIISSTLLLVRKGRIF